MLCFDNLCAQPTPSTSTELYIYRIQSNRVSSAYIYDNTNNINTQTGTNGLKEYWYFESTGTDNQFYIRSLNSGKYMKANGNSESNNRIDLTTTSSNSNNYKFNIAETTATAITTQLNTSLGFNIWSGSTGNGIGFYSSTDGGSKWNLTNKVTSTLQGGLSDFSISGNTTLNAPTTANYSHTNASYTSPHFQFTINSTTYYKKATESPSTTAPTGTTSGITYSWSLSDNMNGYATVSNSGAITYSTLVPEVSRTATLTCTATHTASNTTKEATYTITFINPTILQEPVISYTMALDNLQVTLTHPTTGVTIYYTKDGSDPLTSTTRLTYSSPFNVENNTTVKAYVEKTGMTSSTVASKLIQMSSGIVGNAVILYDLEDHNWTYYKGIDASVDANYNTKYLYTMFSPDPRDVKITYRAYNTETSKIILSNTETNIGSGTNLIPYISSASGEQQSTFIYYKTLEKFVIGMFADDANWDGKPDNPSNAAEQYPYTVISNPFSKRPKNGSNYYGFAGWKIISGGEYIREYTNNQVIPLDATIHFQNLSASSVTDIVLEATWAVATVTTADYVPSFTGGTYETNFWVITGNISGPSISYPCTITAMTPDGGATTNNYNNYTISGNITANTDNIKLEWVKLNMNDDNNINAQGYNFTMGRGIVNNQTNGCRLYGTNTNRNCVQTLKAESGVYTRLYHINKSISSGNSVNQLVIIGCDYDRARAVNDPSYNTKLKIQNARMGSDPGRSAGVLYTRSIVKSGTLQTHVDANGGSYNGGSSNYENYYMSASQKTGQRFLTVEGGHFQGGITGGSDGDGDESTMGYGGSGATISQHGKRGFTLRVRGNAIIEGLITGAADQQNSSGDRVFVFTGGQIGGWVSAGSNGVTDAGGKTDGMSYVYVGGETEINSHLFTNNPQIMGHSTGGAVYGTGCGISSTSTSGQMTDGTNVVLADNAYVERGIYGGGALGYVLDDKTSNIYITGGHVGAKEGQIKNDATNPATNITLPGGVFGGACYRGGGTANIYMYGGLIEGGIYGGSNANGSLAANANVVINGGQVGLDASHPANVHGGGLGSPTRVLGSVNVTVGKSGATTGATIYGDVYGGSAEGKTNGNTARTTDAVTNVTFNAGTINGNFYGGGLGTSSNAADVWGPVQVKMNGGEVNNVFGCNNVNGRPRGTVSVQMTGGEVHECVYGGGNAAAYTGTPEVSVEGGEVHQHVFGGGLGSGATITGSTHVIIQGTAHIDGNVYGGGNGGLVTGNTHVDIK